MAAMGIACSVEINVDRHGESGEKLFSIGFTMIAAIMIAMAWRIDFLDTRMGVHFIGHTLRVQQ